MRRDTLPLLVASIAAVLLSVPAVASAKPGFIVWGGERTSQLSAKGTHGFRITVTGRARYVELHASSGDAAAIYVVRSPRRDPLEEIEATFPGLGKVSARFHPVGPVRRVPAFCGGSPWIRQNGVFRGTIRFQGEQGFTHIDVESARGFTFRSPREVCKGSSGSDSEGPPSYFLAAAESSPTRSISFAAVKSADVLALDRSASYFASHWEKRRGMVSVRIASADAGRDTFAIGGPPFRPESATVAPPTPFSGTASFQASPGATGKWEGTLAVELPGLGSVPLTGPRFKSELCRRQRCLGRPSR